MEPSSGKAKPGRTRAACTACEPRCHPSTAECSAEHRISVGDRFLSPGRANKQKCDGAHRYPCRRCELYGLECDSPQQAGHQASSNHNQQPSPRIVPQNIAPAPAKFSSSSSANETSSLQASLREITERLRQIETGLENDRRNFHQTRAQNSSNSHSHARSSYPFDPTGPPSRAETVHEDVPIDSNPLQILQQTVRHIVEMENDETEDDDETDFQGEEEENFTAPDALTRRLVTLEQARAAFEFFHGRVQPWVPMFNNPDDQDSAQVRTRSPLLFHVILLIAHYYENDSSERGKSVYRAICEIVNTHLAWTILAPTPAQLNKDSIRALVLLLYYKPVQHTAFQSRGVSDEGKIVHTSKINALSSLMLHGLMHRTADFLGLNEAPRAFLGATNPPSIQTSSPEILRNLRIHFWLCICDIHGSLQSGRPASTNPEPATRTTRAFATLSAQPTDARLAAILELYAIVATPPDCASPVKRRLLELGRMNEDLDRWERDWKQILTQRQQTCDELAYTVFTLYREFVTFSANCAVFTRWTLERQRSLAVGGSGKPTLTSTDWYYLQRAADAAQRTVFAVSAESTLTGDPLRPCRWPESRDGTRQPLTLDQRVVQDYRTAQDTTTCISVVYALILLVRMNSAGLISNDLEIRRNDYEHATEWSQMTSIAPQRKLCRLLELGAQFLRGLAINSQHPAHKHSILITMILNTGLNEQQTNSFGDRSIFATTATRNSFSLPSGSNFAANGINSSNRSLQIPNSQNFHSSSPTASSNGPSPDAGGSRTLENLFWNAPTPKMARSSNGNAFFMPAAAASPNQTNSESDEALRTLLLGVDPFLSNFYSTNGLAAGELESLENLTKMDFGLM